MISSKKLSEQRQHLQDDRITIIFAKFLRMKWFLFFLMIPLGFYALSFTFTLLKVDIGVDKKFTNASISLHAREESLSEKFIAPNYQQMVTSLDDDRPVYQIEESSSKTFWPTIPDIHWNYMPRVFTFSNGESSWCLKKSESGQGLLFAKVHKAASSTLSGINLRIASHHNCASTKQEHDDSSNLRYRDRTKSFLYASIRDPAQRALSWQMYILSNHDQEITSEHLMTMFKQKVYFVKATKDSEDFRNEAGAQVGYLHPFKLPQQRPLWDSLEPDLIQNITLAQLRVKQILDFYDFILLVERLDESLVVLQLLLGLDATDIVYVSSKQSGGYSVRDPPRYEELMLELYILISCANILSVVHIWTQKPEGLS